MAKDRAKDAKDRAKDAKMANEVVIHFYYIFSQ